MSTTAITVEYIRDVARGDAWSPEVREFAEIVRRAAENLSAMDGQVLNAIHFAEAVERIVEANVVYVEDFRRVPGDADYLAVRRPVDVLRGAWRGDCKTHAALIAATLIALGMNPQIERLGYGLEDRSDPYSHVIVFLDGQEHGLTSSVMIDSTTTPADQHATFAGAKSAALTRTTRR